MEEFKAFFNPTQKFEPIIYRGPTIDGLRLTKEDELCYSDRKVEHRHSVVPERTDYAREVKENETKLYLKNAIEHRKCQSRAGGMESLEHLSTLGASQPNIGELTEEAMTEVYSKYSFQRKEDTKNLSINDYKQDVLDRICGFRVVIIEGPTGCGKTTQVPQWILDDSYQRRKPCKIIVTQPRRIAAISIAKRVAQERGWDVGGLVGYQVGLDNKTTTDSRIMYVTTGVLLQKLVAAKNLNEYTHIILDEVHERGQEMDFLLIVVKKLLFTVSPQVKVILMSATFNSVAFADYFTLTTAKNFSFTSCIKIVKKDPLYTVKTFYLNDLKKFGGALHKAALKDDTPGVATEMHHLVLKLIDAFERIDMEEDYGHDRSDADIPSVLIFLPGINEIEELYECLTNLELRKKVVDEQCSRYSWWVLPLHSTITADEQARVFQHAPPGKRKIILATNIAESSITVPDIKYVIDYCLMKVLVVDEATNFTSLRLSWASKSNCDQRAGRAGRVRNGRVYRLVTDSAYERFNDECDPEIKRCPLERLVLLAKMLDMGPPSDVLALAMEPPEISNIHRTILVLKEVGALKKLTDEEWDPEDGEITYLGRIMARLPLDVRVSKLIVLGHIYGVLDEAVVMAAAMSVKSLFSNPFRERLAAYNSKLTWADGSTSDSITYLNVYKVWRHLRQQQQFKSGGAQAAWARQFFLQVRALRELDDLVRELRARLARDGIDSAGAPSVWAKQEVPLVLKMVLAGAFYPQYFVQTSQVEEREREAVRVLGGFNPRNTVYLKDFPLGQPGKIYVGAIQKAVRDTIGEEPTVTVDKNSSKVYLTFQDTEQTNNKMNYDPTIPGQVLLAVYKAVKARQLKMDIRIPILPKEKANQLAQVLEASRALALGGEGAGAAAPRLPDVDDTHIAVKISDMVSVGQFWCQYDDECTPCELRRIERQLAASALPPAGELSPGDVLAAPYVDAAGTTACRARVLRLLPNKMVEIRYIDYGSFARICASNLRQLPAELRAPPPLAMQCRLAGVAPAPLLDAHGRWAPGALACFNAHVARGKLLAKVYSVAHGVVSLELLANGGTLNINEILVEQGFAVRCEESYESKLNHDLRQTAADLDIKLRRAHNREQAQLAVGDCDALALASPSRNECDADVLLKGPHSPLEMNVQTLMYAGQEMQVHVEWSSVNSVLLDTAPQELYVRLMVAAEVGQNEANTKLTLRHTTLMPNIPALPAIVALLYCPTTELRRDDEGSRYVSALCGLGSHADGRPYFAEHDLLVDIDADFTVEDIGLINHVRHLMDYMLYYGDGEDAPAPDDSFRHSVPNLIRSDLFKLLNRRRRRRERVSVRRAWEWRSAADDETLEISAPDMLEHTVVYPLHAPQELRPRSREHLLALKRHNDELKMRVSRSSMSAGQLLSCKLCDTVPMSAQAMRLHLFSNTHTEKEEDFLIFRS